MTGTVVWVDPVPVREHVECLLAAGLQKAQIARRAGIAPHTITALLVGVHGRGPSERVRQDTAARLLAVEPELVGPDTGSWVNPIGTIRRLRSLVALGWPVKQMARMAGVPDTSLWPLLNGRHSAVIRASTRDRVMGLYERLTAEPAPDAWMGATWARNRAARMAWPLPCAWTGSGIDDPRARPVRPRYPRPTVPIVRVETDDAPPSKRAWVAIVDWLLEDDPGLTAEQVAARFGREPATVCAALYRAGRPDLWERLNEHSGQRSDAEWWAVAVEDLLETDPDITPAEAFDRLGTYRDALLENLAEADRMDLNERLKRNTVRKKYRETV